MKLIKHDVTPQKMESTREREQRTPATDIYENDKEIVVVADMPGVSEKELEVHLDNQILTLVGNTKADAANDREALYREFAPAEFRRSFTLTEDVDQEKITARIKAGQVRITLPKAAKAQPRKIPVELTA